MRRLPVGKVEIADVLITKLVQNGNKHSKFMLRSGIAAELHRQPPAVLELRLHIIGKLHHCHAGGQTPVLYLAEYLSKVIHRLLTAVLCLKRLAYKQRAGAYPPDGD